VIHGCSYGTVVLPHGGSPNPRYAASYERRRVSEAASLSPRPEWFPRLTPEEIEQEKHLARAISICRGCDLGQSAYAEDAKEREREDFSLKRDHEIVNTADGQD
jgi:hypothetical protein